MKAIAHRAAQQNRSSIRESLDRALQTPGCIRLEVGEPDFPTPAHITEAAARALRDGCTRYTSSQGVLALRQAIVDKLRHLNGVSGRGVDSLLVTPGATFALAAAMEAIIEPGDEILLPDPGWPVYALQVTASGGRVQFYPCDRRAGFAPDLDALESLITPRTKGLLFCNPSNPTGTVYGRETVERLVALAQKHDLFVFSDEVYEQVVFAGQATAAAALDPERVIAVYSFSKTYSMTGWRVGYALAAPSLIKVMTGVLEARLLCTAAVSQMAALAALTGPQDCVAEMVRSYHARRDLVLGLLKENGLFQYAPQGAFFIMVDIGRTGMSSYDFCRGLLQERLVSIVPGGTFGPSSDSLVRVSFAASPDALTAGVSRLCEYLAERAPPSRPAAER